MSWNNKGESYIVARSNDRRWTSRIECHIDVRGVPIERCAARHRELRKASSDQELAYFPSLLHWHIKQAVVLK
jgi:hypothetical protein